MSRKTQSARQLEANRRNALKSTGPRTPEGKLRASRNAVTHGLTARHEVLSIEDRAEYEALRAALISEHQPVGVQELLLVTQVAAAFQRIQRIHLAQVAIFEQHLDEDESATGGATLANSMTRHAAAYDVLRRYEATANSVYFRSLNQLLKLQAIRRRTENGFVSQPVQLEEEVIRAHSRPFAAKKAKIEIPPPQDRECRTPSSTCTATPTTLSSTEPVKSSA
jgi:hypothetical protein